LDIAFTREVHRRELVGQRVRHRIRRHLRELGQVDGGLVVAERLTLDVVAGLDQLALDVGARGFVARSAGRASAAIGIRDLLQRLQVLLDALGRDRLAERGRTGLVVATLAVAVTRSPGCGGAAGKRRRRQRDGEDCPRCDRDCGQSFLSRFHVLPLSRGPPLFGGHNVGDVTPVWG